MKNRIILIAVAVVALLALTAYQLHAAAQARTRGDGSLELANDTDDVIGFYGATGSTQQVVNAAATTNSAATVYTYAITAAAPVTNVSISADAYVTNASVAVQTVSLTDTNGVTALAVTNVTITLQSAAAPTLTVNTGAAPTLTTPTTNAVNGTATVLINQIRTALVNLGLVQ